MKRRGRKKSEGINHRTSFLQTAERTLDVLEILSKQSSLRIVDLSNILNVGASTTHRILATLQKKGFVAQNPDSEKYSLGHMVFRIARAVIHMIKPKKYVVPYLDVLCKQTGENAAFAVITPGKDRTLVLAEKITDEKAVIAKPILFQHFPLHVCSCGKAYLLTLNDTQLKSILNNNGMAKFTKYTLSFTNLKKQLNKFSIQGYTVSRDEYSLGLTAIAAGLCNAEDEFIGAVMILGPSFRFKEKNIRQWGRLLLKTAAKINLELKTNDVT